MINSNFDKKFFEPTFFWRKDFFQLPDMSYQLPATSYQIKAMLTNKSSFGKITRVMPETRIALRVNVALSAIVSLVVTGQVIT